MSNSLLGLMDSFLQKARTMEKKATDPSEPTTHPVMNVDDGTQKAQTGARDTEHKKDIKDALGESGIAGQEDASAAGDGKVPADSIGTQKMDSAEVKGNVQNPKATKDGPAEGGRGDASSGHPSNQTFQEKYSSAQIEKMGNEILASIATTKTAEDAPKGKMPPALAAAKKKDEPKQDEEMEAKKAAAEKYKEDAEKGWMAAHLLAESIMSKEAEEQQAGAAVEGIVKSAQDDASLFCDFLEGMQKGAALSSTLRRNVKKAELPAEALAGGGGIPPEALAGAGGGGLPMPPEAMAGAGGAGGGDEEAAIEALAQSLAEAGVTPEELAQVIAEQGGVGGEAGGPPPAETGAGLAEGAPAEGGEKEEKEEGEEKEEKKEAKAAQVKKAALINTIRQKLGK